MATKAQYLYVIICTFSITITHLLIPSLAHVHQSTHSYIVHMDISTMPKVYTDHHSWYMATLASLTSTTSTTTLSPTSKLIYTYTHVMHGFSALLSTTELEKIKNSPGYLSSRRDVPVKLDTTHSFKFLGLNPDSGAWPESDYGKDVIVGLIDTGVWPESKSYNDYGMTDIPSRWKGACEVGTQFNSSLCNKKLIGARFFSKGLQASRPNITISMNSPRDTDGHGTHTSSTAAGNYVDQASYFGYANGTARGMAPNARIAMYKALFDEGSVSSDILAAIDQAILDGVDVMSLSLGLDGAPLYEDPVAIATFAAMEKGIFVATSAGNEGPFLGTLHNGTPWVLTVAAGTVDREFIGDISLGDDVIVTGQTLFIGNSSFGQHYQLIFLEKCEDEEKLKSIGGKIVMCHDVNDTLLEQVYAVVNSKAGGGIFITNNSDIGFFLQSSIPSFFVKPEDGEIVLNYVHKNNGNSTVSFEFQKTRFGTKPTPRVVSYSSRGPSGSCPFVLKPDIMGPGDLILAAWPETVPATDLGSTQLFSNFNLLSGTSMSTPHVAGVAALLRGVHPEWTPAAIRSAMMTTSQFLDNRMRPIQDIGTNNLEATPLAIGAGHIDPNKALDPGLVYDLTSQDYINLLCALNYTKNQIQTITKSSSNNCSNPSLDLNYPSFVAFFNANDTNVNATIVQVFQRTLTNIVDGNAVYHANLSPMEGLKVSVVPDKLVFKEIYEKQSYKLSIEGPRLMTKRIVHGSISWVEVGGTHVVRSPIVATNLSSDMFVGEGN